VIDARSQSGRILVVEDEALLQMLAIENLEAMGFKGEGAGSATEALNKLRRMPSGFDGAMVDLGLPDRQGDTLVHELRAIAPSMPIVVVSGQGQLEMSAKFKNVPRLTLLAKPYAIDQLLAAFAALGIKRPAGTPPA
jgi:two-component system response regulator PhoP